MKKTLVMAVLAASSAAFAADVTINNVTNGSGTPGSKVIENATIVDNAKVENDILHAPQYMPNYPTAATIWPRVVEVPCVKAEAGLKCDGYKWTPSMGRGEYLFITPRVVEPVKPEVRIYTEVREVPVYKEVPAKKIKE